MAPEIPGRNTELRKLPTDFLSSVEDILETNKDWETLMSLIPENLEELGEECYKRKFNELQKDSIRDHAKNIEATCANVLFSEWGTFGRTRPTLDTLQKLLIKAEMFKAADVLAVLLNEPLPQRPLDGPAARVDLNVTGLLNTHTGYYENTTKKIGSSNSGYNQNMYPPSIQKSTLALIQFSDAKPTMQVDNSNLIEFSESAFIPVSGILNPKSDRNVTRNTEDSDDFETSDSDSHSTQISQSATIFPTAASDCQHQIDKDILKDIKLIQFSFQQMEEFTEHFSKHIGSGGFGDVYLGKFDPLGSLAVKQITNNSIDLAIKTFNSEVKALSYLIHPNIVPIWGISIDGPVPCIVCEYIEGGSLKQKLADKELDERKRIDIMKGTAEGLKYMHTTEKPSSGHLPSTKKTYFIHGDVKSANILLTKTCLPKLCDFGLSKACNTTTITKDVIGTMEYMAPERLKGTITNKGDVYSYGIVLLELLTGLGAIVKNEEGQFYIRDYIEDKKATEKITPLLAEVVGEWNNADSVYDIAKLCLRADKNERPSMNDICKALSNL